MSFFSLRGFELKTLIKAFLFSAILFITIVTVKEFIFFKFELGDYQIWNPNAQHYLKCPSSTLNAGIMVNDLQKCLDENHNATLNMVVKNFKDKENYYLFMYTLGFIISIKMIKGKIRRLKHKKDI